MRKQAFIIGLVCGIALLGAIMFTHNQYVAGQERERQQREEYEAWFDETMQPGVDLIDDARVR